MQPQTICKAKRPCSSKTIHKTVIRAGTATQRYRTGLPAQPEVPSLASKKNRAHERKNTTMTNHASPHSKQQFLKHKDLHQDTNICFVWECTYFPACPKPIKFETWWWGPKSCILINSSRANDGFIPRLWGSYDLKQVGGKNTTTSQFAQRSLSSGQMVNTWNPSSRSASLMRPWLKLQN